MSIIGPNAKVRVGGRGDHDLATFEWTVTRTKTPFGQIGDEYAKSYTSGPVECTFTGTVRCKPGGTWAIDWDSWCIDNEVKALVADSGGRKERLIDCALDEVGSSIDRGEGVFEKSISGKFKRPRYE
jgi:hypothetical protein